VGTDLLKTLNPTDAHEGAGGDNADLADAVSRLASGVAHDFNNLLTIINGYSDMALEGLPAADPLRASVAEILAAGLRATAIAGQLLAVSGRQRMNLTVLDLNAVVAACGGPARLELSPAACPVLADAGQLAQLVHNLVGHFGGPVAVTTSHTELAAVPFARLTVTGTSHGVAPELLPRIFEPYVCGGLELAVVAGVARQLGGRATAECGPDAGLTFVVEIPRGGLTPRPS